MALLSSQRLLLDPVYCSIVALLAAHYSAVEEGQGTLSRHRLIWNQGGGWNTQHIFVECVFSSCISYFSHQLYIVYIAVPAGKLHKLVPLSHTICSTIADWRSYGTHGWNTQYLVSAREV